MVELLDVSLLDQSKLKLLYSDAANSVLKPLDKKWHELYGKDLDPDFKLFEEYDDGKKESLELSFHEFISFCHETGDYRDFHGLPFQHKIIQEPVSENPRTYDELIDVFSKPEYISDNSWKNGLNQEEIESISADVRAREKEIYKKNSEIEKQRKRLVSEYDEYIEWHQFFLIEKKREKLNLNNQHKEHEHKNLNEKETKFIKIGKNNPEYTKKYEECHELFRPIMAHNVLVRNLFYNWLATPNENILKSVAKTQFNESLKGVAEYLNGFNVNATLLIETEKIEDDGKIYRCMLSLPTNGYPVLYHMLTGSPDMKINFAVSQASSIYVDNDSFNGDLHGRHLKYHEKYGIPLYFQKGMWSDEYGFSYDRDSNTRGGMPTRITEYEIQDMIKLLEQKGGSRIRIDREYI